MAEDTSTGWQKTLDVANVIGAIGIVGGVMITVAGWLLSWDGWAIGSGGTAILLGAAMVFARFVSVRADAPLETIATWKQGYSASAPAQASGHRPALAEPEDRRHVLLDELEEEYELKKLKPHFVDQGNEYVEAHNDEKGVIVRGSSPDRETFHVLARSFGNEHPREKVKSVKKVSFRPVFICFDRETKNKASAGVRIHRGAWLSEAEIEVDFRPHCPPQRAIIVTAEGSEKHVYAVRRDFDSTYKGILPLREELTGRVYTVVLTLLEDSKNSATFQYILEIIREPGFDLRLTNAAVWKSEHIQKFFREGIVFSERLHQIWKDVHEQFPTPPAEPVTNRFFLSGAYNSEPFDYVKNASLVRAAEREQEEKMLDEIKDWETRAADWVDLFIGAEQRDKLLTSVPSIEGGFNRVQKSRFGLRMPSLEGKPAPPPPLPYWQLSDAVSSRTDVLMKMMQQL
jgi:hypothetical protein